MARKRPSQHNSVRPELRSLHSPDLPEIGAGLPSDVETFSLLLQAMIGPAGEPGEESFDFVVCSVKWLSDALDDKKFVFGKHYLIIKTYDFHLIEVVIQSLCNQIVGESWQDVAQQLGQYGKWEFQDYVTRPPESD